MNLFLLRALLLYDKFTAWLKALTLKKLLLLSSRVVAVVFALLLLLVLMIWTGLLGSMPNKKELLAVQNPTASEVYSADSVLLGRYFIQERSNITFQEIPAHTIQALIATEDVRFYNHHGIDMRSVARVLVKSLLLQRESSGGGSTITQQLAKNLYPRKDYWFFSLFINKVREMLIASRLEAVYDKEAILTLYLNTIPFGDNTYGLGTGAQRFFSVPAKELSINQSAVLIGMLKATRSYNPRIFPEQSLQRRNVVLAQMGKYKFLKAAQVDSLQALPIQLHYNKITHHTGLAPYFREYLRQQLVTWCDQYNLQHEEEPVNLYTDGLKIYTTIDSRLQRYAEAAMAKQMTETQKTFYKHWGKRDPWQQYPGYMDEVILKSERYQNLKAQGLSHEEIITDMNKPVPMTIFNWEGEKEVMMSSIDSLKHYQKILNAGMLAIDPAQGAIRVWVGGINHNFFQYDHVQESTKRQVGSTFKPIVYAAALEQGVDPCSFISAEKITYTGDKDWAPANSEDNYELRYSFPGALAYSVNTVSVRVLEKAGINNTIQLARSMGIKSSLAAVPSIALGTPDISMMEMVSAYACFANLGKATEPFYMTAITSHDNVMLEQFKPTEATQAMSAESAALMVHMLRRAVNEGTSSSLRSRFGLTNDIAGKTGTTQSNTDGWFMAITPKLVMGAWVGADDPKIRFRSTALGQGSRTALPIVGEFIRLSNQDKELNSITRARFAPLPNAWARKIDCDLYRSDNFLERLVGSKDKQREFGKEKKGFFKRLFEKK
ncbi:MAG TPA: transglycosylase domain-containing protein [Cyclobacteriaceae bacterium]|nr:transglycosylase domain-containing protein [Cyclobacteriaceae bacterium]HPW61748.1 transglycosylase domain-containing protein [Cyclobacteriaceae bacterium]